MIPPNKAHMAHVRTMNALRAIETADLPPGPALMAKMTVLFRDFLLNATPEEIEQFTRLTAEDIIGRAKLGLPDASALTDDVAAG